MFNKQASAMLGESTEADLEAVPSMKHQEVPTIWVMPSFPSALQSRRYWRSTLIRW
tara:strand:+ start:754 stop:921 length:168 start_codon:yes stop_codon:yes gene_type:complete